MNPRFRLTQALRDAMKNKGLRVNQVAREIDVEPTRLSKILNCSIRMTPAFGLKLESVLGVSAAILLTMQAFDDLAEEKVKLGQEVTFGVPRLELVS